MRLFHLTDSGDAPDYYLNLELKVISVWLLRKAGFS